MNDTAVQSGADNVKILQYYCVVLSKFAVDKAFIFQQIYIINISVDLHSMKEEEGYGGG